MPLSDLTDPAAVDDAMNEFDRIGRDNFLQKYGFGPSRAYFVRRDGKYYDSKAIVGAAHGYQYPQKGQLRAHDFSGGENTVRAKLEALGFSVEVRGSDEPPTVTSHDIELIRQSRSRDRYTDFSDEERAAHKRVHEALRRLGEIAVDELGGARDYVLKLTSGFHPASGIRGGKPKDLWFGVFRKENEQQFLGNPQIFMIVSGRGIEYGFSPLNNPDDFFNQEIKRRTREIARSVLEQLPVPGSPEATDLAAQLLKSGNWHYRRKQRLEPNQSEYQSLDDWLSFVRSDEGVRNAGGGITRYAAGYAVDKVDLVEEVRQIAELFRPLMEHIVANAPPTTAPKPPAPPTPTPGGERGTLPSFSDLLRTFLREFVKARSEPFQKTAPPWNAMSAVKTRIEQFAAVKSRPDLLVSISVGQGNWATVPWIAILNTRITKSTQEGVYIAPSLSRQN
jgi:MrcB-like, N-terminal domain